MCIGAVVGLAFRILPAGRAASGPGRLTVYDNVVGPAGRAASGPGRLTVYDNDVGVAAGPLDCV